jgi:HlyD family secretion protein
VAYQSAAVARKTLTTTVAATGNLEPTNTVDVGIEVSGTIAEVLVDYNDQVKTGQLMARLDTTRLASALESSKAALSRYRAHVAEAKAALVYANNESERVRKMYAATNGNYPSRQEMDNTRAARDKAQAQYDAALAQAKQASDELASNQYNLDKAIVVSPINGIVLERKVEPGQTVVASMQTPVLFKMAEDLTQMKAIVSVDEADIGEVREKQKVRFTVDAYPGKTFMGSITQLRLNSQIVNGVVTYDAVVTVQNPDVLLRPGMTVSAYIITGVLANVLTVPNAALRFTPPSEQNNGEKKAKNNTDASARHVWVLRDNQPVKIAVETGKSDGISTVITNSTLTTDDAVLIGTQQP